MRSQLKEFSVIVPAGVGVSRTVSIGGNFIAFDDANAAFDFQPDGWGKQVGRAGWALPQSEEFSRVEFYNRHASLELQVSGLIGTGLASLQFFRERSTVIQPLTYTLPGGVSNRYLFAGISQDDGASTLYVPTGLRRSHMVVTNLSTTDNLVIQKVAYVSGVAQYIQCGTIFTEEARVIIGDDFIALWNNSSLNDIDFSVEEHFYV